MTDGSSNTSFLAGFAKNKIQPRCAATVISVNKLGHYYKMLASNLIDISILLSFKSKQVHALAIESAVRLIFYSILCRGVY